MDYSYICKNRNLAIYLLDQDYIVNLKVSCNVVRIATRDAATFSLILSKRIPFISIINFHKNTIIHNGNFHLLYLQKFRSRLQKFLKNGIMHRIKDSTFKKKSFNITNINWSP
ncbi:putative glutamate receptor [Vespula maculifrons]|uniref:Glutamate receptor n=1 Tax=Vespula maculifrons TaxID=7453 RepID=A0ABD2CW50_VESMC